MCCAALRNQMGFKILPCSREGSGGPTLSQPPLVTTQMDSQKSLIYIEMFLACLSSSVKKILKNPCLGNSNLLLRPYLVTTER